MRMKKWICLLLALALTLTAAGALAAKGDANFGMGDELYEKYGDNVRGGFVLGDALYLYGGSHLYTWHVGDAELSALEFEIPEAGEHENRNLERMFTDGERIWALFSLYRVGEEEYSLIAPELAGVELVDGAVRFGETRRVENEDLFVSYGDINCYLIQINDACCVGDMLYLLIYDDSGRVYALNLESGAGEFLEVDNAIQIAPYADGQLLIERYDYSAQECEFFCWDGESESLSSVYGPAEAQGSGYRGIAYSQESGKLFFLEGGYVKAAENFDLENARSVAELSAEYYSDAAGALLPGDYYVFSNYSATSVRATGEGALPDTRLTVLNGSYSEALTDAYYSFTEAHDDVAVVLSQDYMEDSKIIESMLNRDSSIDVYLMGVQSQAYDALFERGYMAEMDDDEIRAAVEKMYPGMRAALERDGEVVAIPVGVYGWVPGVNLEGFEALGISPEEIPADWAAFLDFLAELPDRLPEDGSVRIFDDYMTQNGAKEQLLALILQNHLLYTASNGLDPAFDTPAMQAVLEKVANLDYEAMGLKEDYDEDGGDGIVEAYSLIGAERNYTLVELGVGCTLGNFYSDCDPWLLSIEPDAQPQLPVELSVAFINPFSEHVELAQQFLKEMLVKMEDSVRYNISDELDEPVRSRYYAQNLEYYEKELAGLQAELESADAVDKPVIEQNLKDMEAARENMEKYSWDISRESIDWYRAHAQNLAVQRYSPMYSDEGGELQDLVMQFIEGRIDASAFLRSVDQKVRMMMLEGN